MGHRDLKTVPLLLYLDSTGPRPLSVLWCQLTRVPYAHIDKVVVSKPSSSIQEVDELPPRTWTRLRDGSN